MNLDLIRKWKLTELCRIAYDRIKYNDSAVGKNFCIKKRVQPIIEKYKNCEVDTCLLQTDPMYVWMLWWQGEEQMPPMIKMCYQSIVNCFEGVAEVRLLTEANIYEYVSLPDYIEDKRKQGAITLTHYSDIVRFHLMNKYGGLWIDATYYAAKRAPKEIFESRMYTIRIPHPNVKHNNDYIWYDWAGNFMKLPAGSVLGKFMEDSFLYYWKNSNILMEYYFIDHLLRIAYDSIPGVREEIEKCGFNNVGTHKLLTMLNEPLDKEKYGKLIDDTNFFKLTTKADYRRFTESGQRTLFSYLCDELSL